MESFRHITNFEWDRHNAEKNWKKHGVKFSECEEVFFDPGLKVMPDDKHSLTENRWLALGKSKESRLLFLAFTERSGKVRVISARDMHAKERRAYHEKI